MPVIQLLCHPGSLPPMGKAKAVLDGNDPSVLNKVPFYIFLRLDLFHLSGPQGMVGPTPATTVQWFTPYSKKSPVEKLKALKALITPLITEMPVVEGIAEQEESPEATLAAKALKDSFDEVKTTPGAEDEVPFAQAQPRPSTPVAPVKPKLVVVAKPAKAAATKPRKPRSPKHEVSSSDDDSSSSDTDSSDDEDDAIIDARSNNSKNQVSPPLIVSDDESDDYRGPQGTFGNNTHPDYEDDVRFFLKKKNKIKK